MAVSTQQPKVPAILRPIGESSGPTVLPPFGLMLLLWVNVVDVQHPYVVNAAALTLAAEFSNQRELAFPVSRGLMQSVAISIPKGIAALAATEADIARRSTPTALAVTLPPVSQITLPPAKLSCAVAKAVGVHGRFLPAVFANDLSRCSSHNSMISDVAWCVYFDSEPAPQIVQPGLFTEDVA